MSGDSLPQRLHYPSAEASQPWLAALLDADHEIDRGVHEAVRREERQGRWLAWSRGCAACCRSHQDIPLAQPLLGVDWSRLAARMEGPGRAGSGVEADLGGRSAFSGRSSTLGSRLECGRSRCQHQVLRQPPPAGEYQRSGSVDQLPAKSLKPADLTSTLTDSARSRLSTVGEPPPRLADTGGTRGVSWGIQSQPPIGT